MPNFIYYALGANFSFALGVIVFTHYSSKISSAWMNCAKAFVAFLLFIIYVFFIQGHQEFGTLSGLLLVISGFIGLGIGDIFLLKAFSVLGPGRTLMLFGFQPIFLSLMGYLIFEQSIDPSKFISIIFFVCCLFTLSLESFRKDKHWGVRGMLLALTGVLLDSSGVLITRYAFDMSPELSAMQGNLYRCFGALVFFFILSFIKPFEFASSFLKLKLSERFLIVGGSILGTFLSLSLYLKALQTAHLGQLSGINITSTLFSNIFEVVFFKKRPSIYLGIAFAFFACGMYFLI